jgi:phosphotransferase system HPr (HPr) family protein
MDTILVVCGAGASSTFLASRLRTLAKERGLNVTARAASTDELESRLSGARAVLVGPHLAARFEELTATAAGHSVPTALLPANAFEPASAGAALDLALSLLPETITDSAPETKDPLMAERTVTIASAHGLHARPASLFVQAVTASGLPVELTKGEKTLNAASILGVISLGIEHGDEVTLRATGDNAEAVLDSLVELLTTDFDA